MMMMMIIIIIVAVVVVTTKLQYVADTAKQTEFVCSINNKKNP